MPKWECCAVALLDMGVSLQGVASSLQQQQRKPAGVGRGSYKIDNDTRVLADVSTGGQGWYGGCDLAVALLVRLGLASIQLNKSFGGLKRRTHGTESPDGQGGNMGESFLYSRTILGAHLQYVHTEI